MGSALFWYLESNIPPTAESTAGRDQPEWTFKLQAEQIAFRGNYHHTKVTQSTGDLILFTNTLAEKQRRHQGEGDRATVVDGLCL